LLEQLVNGLTLGCVYALIALGYTMVYGIIKLINFAHGEVYMIGAYIGMVAITRLHFPIWVAILLAMGVCILLALLMERVAYRPLRKSKSSRLSSLISAIGVSIFLSTLMQLIHGPQTTNFSVDFPFKWNIGVIHFSGSQLVILVVTALLMLGLTLFVKYTKTGKAMRACSEEQDAAWLMGINVNRIIAVTFVAGAALAAVAGVLIGMYTNAFSPMMGTMAGLKAFAAAVLGGIGSIPGAMVGGLFLGVAEVFGVVYIDSAFRDAIAFAILILVLLFRPTGLLGRPEKQKV
jgi:branched-chain amino acid transport system permease protein